MERISKIVIFLFIFWFLSVMSLLLPISLIDQNTLATSSNWVVHRNPDGDRILAMSENSGKVMLFDSDLNTLAIQDIYVFGGSSYGVNWMNPIWSHDGNYIIVQSEYLIFYLNADSLQINYLFNKWNDLGINRDYSHVNLDKENNLIFTHINRTIRSLNPKTLEFTDLANLGVDGLEVVHSDPNYKYLAMRCCRSSGGLINDQYFLIYDIELNEFYNLSTNEYPDRFISGSFTQFLFAPSKPYIAIVNSNLFETETRFKIMNLKTKEMGEEHVFPKHTSYGSSWINHKLAWSADSSEILFVEHGLNGKKEVVGNNIFRTYNVISGEKTQEISFSRGPLYESAILDYLWLSDEQSIIVVDQNIKQIDDSNIHNSGKNKIIKHRVDSQMIFIHSVVDYIFLYVGFLTSILIMAVYTLKNSELKLGNYFNWSRNNGNLSLKENILSSKIQYKHVRNFQFGLFSYSIMLGILYGSLAFREEHDLRIAYGQSLVFSIFSTLDILFIWMLTISYLNRNSRDKPDWKNFKITTVVLIISMFVQKLIFGYQFGVNPGFIPSEIATYLLIIVSLVIVILLYRHFLILIKTKTIHRIPITYRPIPELIPIIIYYLSMILTYVRYS